MSTFERDIGAMLLRGKRLQRRVVFRGGATARSSFGSERAYKATRCRQYRQSGISEAAGTTRGHNNIDQ